MNLKGKNVIVTGGSGLLGKEIIKSLCKYGANVINIDKNSIDDKNIYFFQCDLTDENQVISCIDEIINKFSVIHALVNNAYPRTIDWGNKFEDIEFTSWKKNVDMQLNSLFLLTKIILNHMKNNKKGSIVNIASIYGVVGSDFSIYENTDGMTSPAAYSAIKGGIINFTRYLSSYFGKYNIRVNCISPGGIIDNQNDNFIKNYSKRVPLKRLAKPDEIAPSVTFLISDLSTYITGHNLIIEGGWTAI